MGAWTALAQSGRSNFQTAILGATTTWPIVLLSKPIIEFILPSALITMPGFRKPKSQATTPPSPADLVQKFTARKEPRALVASSTAIALSIGSAFSSIRDAPSDGVTVQARDADWHTAYGMARMAVELAKETSDLCPPLKAVVGAVSVLIKNYDVSASRSRTEHLLILARFPLSKHRTTRRM